MSIFGMSYGLMTDFGLTPVASGECANNSFEQSEIRILSTQAESEGTTVSVNAIDYTTNTVIAINTVIAPYFLQLIISYSLVIL